MFLKWNIWTAIRKIGFFNILTNFMKNLWPLKIIKVSSYTFWFRLSLQNFNLSLCYHWKTAHMGNVCICLNTKCVKRTKKYTFKIYVFVHKQPRFLFRAAHLQFNQAYKIEFRYRISLTTSNLIWNPLWIDSRIRSHT